MFMRRRSSTELVVTTQCLPRAAVTGVCLASCVVCVARHWARHLLKTQAAAPGTGRGSHY